MRGSVLSVAGLTAAVLVLPSVAVAADAPSTSYAPPPGQVVDRSAFTTTSESASGQMTTRSYPEPVNFKTGSGSWKAVDPTLEHAGDGSVHPADVDGDARIPSSLATPLQLTHDGRSLSLRLHGATGDPAGDRAVSGERAVFDDAIDGVTVKYAARSQGLKETLVLASASAPHSFSYDLAGDDDLEASIDASGDLVLVDGVGKETFRISAPLMWDSASPAQLSDALTLSVSKTSAGHWMLTMAASNSWLNDPARTYPVSLDPDFYWIDSSTQRFHGATQDCFLQGGSSANGNTCAFTQLLMGYINKASRPILRFDVGAAIPAGANISNAQLAMYLPGSGSQPAINSRVRTITSDWDNNATWNNRKTATAWTAPGGDVSTATNLIGTVNPSVGASGYWYYWNVPKAAVQGWVNGTLPNYGIQVRADTEASTTGTFYFNSTENDQATWPALDVTWTLPDVTAPSAPTEVLLEPLDIQDSSAMLTFNPGVDEVGSNGALASGSVSNEYRYGVNGGALSSWQASNGDHQPLPGLSPGDLVSAQVRTVDAAGNISAPYAGAFTVALPATNAEAIAAEAYYASVYNVTPTVASQWISVQSATDEFQKAAETSSFAGQFAGAWLDNATREVHVALTSTAADSSALSLATVYGIVSSVVIDHVTWTDSELGSQAQQATETLDSLISEGVVRVSFNLQEQLVLFEFGANPSTAAQAQVQGARASMTAPTAVSFTGLASVGDTPTTCADAHLVGAAFSSTNLSMLGCAGAIRGGTGIYMKSTLDDGQSPGVCTAGFLATNDDGAPLMITAGHCLDLEKQVDPQFVQVSTLRQTKSDGKLWPVPLGQTYDQQNTNGLDAGVVQITNSTFSKPRPWLLVLGSMLDENSTTYNPHYEITDAVVPVSGTVACATLGRTHAEQCGTVGPAKDGTRNAGFVDDVNPQPGDSGAPVFKGGHAYGVLHGYGIYKDFLGIPHHRMKFYYATSIEDRFHVSVVTPDRGDAAGFYDAAFHSCPINGTTWTRFGCLYNQ